MKARQHNEVIVTTRRNGCHIMQVGRYRRLFPLNVIYGGDNDGVLGDALIIS